MFFLKQPILSSSHDPKYKQYPLLIDIIVFVGNAALMLVVYVNDTGASIIPIIPLSLVGKVPLCFSWVLSPILCFQSVISSRKPAARLIYCTQFSFMLCMMACFLVVLLRFLYLFHVLPGRKLLCFYPFLACLRTVGDTMQQYCLRDRNSPWRCSCKVSYAIHGIFNYLLLYTIVIYGFGLTRVFVLLSKQPFQFHFLGIAFVYICCVLLLIDERFYSCIILLCTILDIAQFAHC